MEIHFWGAAQTVTGSAHYLKINGHTILLDCGLFQGRRKEANRINTEFCFPADKIDAVVLSHAHIDHSGNLPNLVKQGFEGPIHATPATADLGEIMLLDSGHIQEMDVAFINKRRLKQGKELLEPLYTQDDAKLAASYFIEHNLDDPFEVVPGVTATFIEAGHILGSAAIALDIEEGRKKYRLWFSGDIGRTNLPILRDPVLPQDADFLIMECTYGDRPHEPRQNADERLQAVINKTIKRGGKVIIPAFSVGRTQELVYSIHKLMNSGDIPKIPVFVDSPLAVNATDIFKKHRECFDEEAWAMIKSDKHRAALGFDTLTYIRSVEESKELNTRQDPMIIISASGMIEAGRILHHLRHNIHDPNSSLLIVSWQAPYTLGRRMVEEQEQVKIFGEVFERKIQIEHIRGFSAHAGQNLLADYALGLKGRAQDIFLVHGEQRGADGLREVLKDRGLDGLHYPSRGTTYEV